MVPIWYPLIITVIFYKKLQQVKTSGRGIPKIPAWGEIIFGYAPILGL